APVELVGRPRKPMGIGEASQVEACPCYCVLGLVEFGLGGADLLGYETEPVLGAVQGAERALDALRRREGAVFLAQPVASGLQCIDGRLRFSRSLFACGDVLAGLGDEPFPVLPAGGGADELGRGFGPASGESGQAPRAIGADGGGSGRGRGRGSETD